MPCPFIRAMMRGTMKTTKATREARRSISVSGQLFNLIPPHLMLRYLKHVAGWKPSYSRLVGLVRGVVWQHVDVAELLCFYGTAHPPEPDEPRLKAPCLPVQPLLP